MMWIEVHFQADKTDAEMIEGLLMAYGALSTTMIDAADQPLLEPMPGESPLWDEIVVTGLFEQTADSEQILAYISSKVQPKRSWSSTLADEVWERSWMDHFKPIRMGDRLWVVPSWCEPPEPEHTNLLIDPGLAFGTGNHESTQLCLGWLSRQNLEGARVLDFGCGSGILGIGALKLGASSVHAVDIDPLAVDATNQNAALNNLESKVWSGLNSDFDALSPDDRPESFDVICANILAKPLMMLAEFFSEQLPSGGQIVLAGLIVSQQQQVIDAYTPYFILQGRIEAPTGGWLSLSFTRR
jgi:ribosomal protein L11 methyltransferase